MARLFHGRHMPKKKAPPTEEDIRNGDKWPPEPRKRVWGVETRNGGWLSLETVKNGSGSSVTIDKAHRFATKKEAEKVALDFRMAGGQAKRIDGPAWGLGRVPASVTTVPIAEYEALAQRHAAVADDLAQKLATQQRLKEIATENLADALIARDAAWDQRDAALEEVRISKLHRPDGVLSYVAALRLQLDGTASMLAEVYDYVGTKALGEEMAPRVRAHLDALPKLSHSECTLLKKDLQ